MSNEVTCECGCTMSIDFKPTIHSVKIICNRCKKINDVQNRNHGNLIKVQTKCDCGNLVEGKCDVCEKIMCQKCFDTHKDPICSTKDCYKFQRPDDYKCYEHAYHDDGRD